MSRPIVVAIAASLVAACAPVHYTKADIDGRIVCDPDQVDRVERTVRRTFGTVVWVNCPRATLRVVS